MKRKLFILLNVFMFIACKNNEFQKEEQRTYEVISFIINELSTPFPPAPPPPGLSDNEFKQQKDSIQEVFSKKIENVQLDVAVYPVMKPVKFDFDKYKDFIDVKKEANIDEVLTLDLIKINNNKEHRLTYFDTLSKRKIVDNQFDISIQISRIVFNEDYNKALLIAGSGRGKLDGSRSLYILERAKNGRWSIIYEDLLSIS